MRSCRERRGSEGFSGRRRSPFPIVAALAVLVACGFERQSEGGTPGEGALGDDAALEIEGMLEASAASWNRGDLEGFLDDYWRSGELTFSGADGITRGWEDLRTRYMESYWAPGTARDSLRFEEIEVMPLGGAHALALGRYVLFDPEEDPPMTSSGVFSLVLARLEGEWKILHDHTTAAPQEEGPGR